MAVGDIHIEGTVSQNSDICLSFCFMSKKKLIKNELGATLKTWDTVPSTAMF